MPFDVVGRPSRELIGATTSPANQIIRRFDTFGKVFKTNDTATLQAAIDWSADTGIPVGQEGDFTVDGLVLKDGARIIGPGAKSMSLIAHASAPSPGLITLASGVVQNVVLSGFSMHGTVSGQHGIYIKADPTLTGVWQGGLWYFLFEDIELTGFTGETVWLRGYGNASGDVRAFGGPIQFGEFRNVRAFRGGMAVRSLRCSGQVGQIGFNEACQFDSSAAGYADSGTEENILIQRAVHDDGTNESDMAPYSLLFRGTTCQGGKRGITIERANSINMIGMHFENLKEGIMNSISAWGNTVEECVFGLVGINAGAGWGVRNQGGLISCRDLTWNGNASGHTETHYWSDYDQPITLEGFHVDTSGPIITKGVTRGAMALAATIDTGYANHVYVNGPAGATTITNILSQLTPGKFLTIHANAGGLTLGDGTGVGAIGLGPYRAPARIPQDGTALFQRQDLTSIHWGLLMIGGNRGNVRPLGAFVDTAMSPYSIPADSGSVRVATTAGPVTVKLPSITKTPPGQRITVYKISSDANPVYINGNTTAENPLGLSDNACRLVEVAQSMDFERNGLIGEGGWDALAGSSTRTGTPGGGATLTFGTHLTGGSYNAGSAVTLGTDATDSNATNTIVARDASGYASFTGLRIALNVGGTEGILINNSLTLFASSAFTVLASPAGYTTGGRIMLGHPSVDDANYYDATVHSFRSRAGVEWARVDGNLSVKTGNLIFQTDARGLCDTTPTLRLTVTTTGIAVTGTFSVTSSSAFTDFININRPASAPALGISSSVGNTGIAFAPNTGSDSVLIDNNRIGSQMLFRTSYASTTDKTWLTVNAFGQTQWSGPMQVFAVLTIVTGASVTGIDVSDSVGNTGISFTPASSSYTAFVDNRRVGAHTSFRSSNGSAGDTTWLDVFANGNPVFAKIVTCSTGLVSNSNMNVAPTVPALFLSDPGQNVQFVLRPASSSYSAFIDNTRVGAQTVFRNSFSAASDTTWLTVNAAGTCFFAGQVWSDSFRTATPAGGTAANWRFGSLVAATVTVLDTQYVEIDISGSAVRLATVT